EAQDQANQTGQGGDLDRSPHKRMRDAAMIDQVLAPGTGCPGARLQQQLGPVRDIPGDRADPPGGRQFATGDGATECGANEGVSQVVHVVLKASITLAASLAGRQLWRPPAASERAT